MATLLEIPFISQLTDGAEMFHNDCGPACCSMLVAALTDQVVPVNEWYKMDGWGAPTTDIGTYAYQLQAALLLFEITSILGSVLSLESIRSLLDQGRPIIPLVSYKLFADANLTQIKGSFNHWLVISGYDQYNIITTDPYRLTNGLMAVPIDLFERSYLGNYLVTHQTLVTDSTAARLNELTRLNRYISHRKARLIL